MTTQRSYTALVLAGSRRGKDDPVALAGNVSHKCFVDVVGQPMLRRVVAAVLESGRVHHVAVSIDADQKGAAEEMLRPLSASIPVTIIESRGSIGASVMAAIEELPGILPLVITTGDNALHTPEMVRFFCEGMDRCDGDAALGITAAEVLLAAYPEGQRAFHRFRNGSYSSCNIYGLLNDTALAAPRTFNSGGQFAKKPWRFIFSFGLIAFLIYKTHAATLEGCLRYISRALKVDIRPIFMPFPEGPIDVDRPCDLEMTKKIIVAREAG